MKKNYLALPLLLLLLAAGPCLADSDNNGAADSEQELSSEDREILQMLELLEILELLNNLDDVAALEDDQ